MFLLSASLVRLWCTTGVGSGETPDRASRLSLLFLILLGLITKARLPLVVQSGTSKQEQDRQRERQTEREMVHKRKYRQRRWGFVWWRRCNWNLAMHALAFPYPPTAIDRTCHRCSQHLGFRASFVLCTPLNGRRQDVTQSKREKEKKEMTKEGTRSKFIKSTSGCWQAGKCIKRHYFSAEASLTVVQYSLRPSMSVRYLREIILYSSALAALSRPASLSR